MSSQEIETIFSNINDILNLNREILRELKKLEPSNNKSTTTGSNSSNPLEVGDMERMLSIGDVFLKYSDYLKM